MRSSRLTTSALLSGGGEVGDWVWGWEGFSTCILLRVAWAGLGERVDGQKRAGTLNPKKIGEGPKARESSGRAVK
eukprot:420784-Hanusia_phi.AAC.1